MAPTVTPMSVAMAATVSAISMSFSTPAMTWANMSFPMELVPKGLVARRRVVEVVGDGRVAVRQKWPTSTEARPSSTKTQSPTMASALVEEAPEDDAGLALGLAG